jgi:hypothetical protein
LLFIFCFFLGTVIGQAYYRNGVSPLLRTQRLNKSKILKPILWCGQKVVLVYILYLLITPLVYFILNIFISW